MIGSLDKSVPVCVLRVSLFKLVADDVGFVVEMITVNFWRRPALPEIIASTPAEQRRFSRILRLAIFLAENAAPVFVVALAHLICLNR